MTIFFLHFLFLTCCIIYLTKLFIPSLFCCCSIEYLHYVHYISMILEERVWVKKWENLALEKCSVHFLVCNKEVHCSLAIPCVWHGDLFLLVREGRMEGTSRKTSERIKGQSKEQQLLQLVVKSGALWNRNYEEGPASWQSTGTIATIWNYKKQNYPPLNYLHKHVQNFFFLLYFIFICIYTYSYVLQCYQSWREHNVW